MPRRVQSNPPKRRPTGRSGGRSGGAGYDFQDIYVAGQLAKFLTGDDGDAPVEVVWEKKALDTGAGNLESVAVDDAIIRTADGRWVFVQVKQTGPRAGWSIEELARTGIARQLWNQWSSRPEGERPKTIVRFATGGDCQRLRVLVDVAARARTPAELLSDEATKETARDIRSLAATLRLGTSSPELLSFLKAVHIEPLPGAEELEGRVAERLAVFGAKAQDLKSRIIRIVARSKHLGAAARSAHTRATLVQALLDDGVPEATLMITGLVTFVKGHDAAFWDKYRADVVTRFSKLRVYGLEINAAVYADLPSLFVPLKLAPMSRENATKQNNNRAAHTRRSIEEIVVGEERPTDDDGAEEPQKNSKGVVELSHAFTQHRRIGLIGGPGAGKTTMLKWWAIIAAAAGNEAAATRQQYGLPSEPMVPLYVRFRDFARWAQASGMDGMEGKFGLVANFVAATLQRDFGQKCPTKAEALAVADELLRSDKTIFLFDGLDEVPDERLRQRLFDAVADLLKSFKEPCVILTTRPYAIAQDRLPFDLMLFEPLPLDRGGRRTFATQWYRAITLQVDDAFSELEAKRRAHDLASTAEKLREISENPLLMSILALIHFNRNGLSVERATLYDHATMAMLGHWDRSPLGRDLGDDAIPADWAKKLQLHETQIQLVVQCLASQVQFQEGGSEFSSSTALESLRNGVIEASSTASADARAELLLRLLVERSGLLQERSPGILAFTHLSFQEYLAAKRLLALGDSGLRQIAATASEDKHAEVVRFAVALLATDDGKVYEERVHLLFQEISEQNPVLAAACLVEAPSLHLEPAAAEQLARRVYSECSGHGRHFRSPRFLSKVVWTVLRSCENADRLVLEFLASGEEGHRGRGPMEFEGPMGILVGRPVSPPSRELRWVLERISQIEPRHHDGLQGIARLILTEAGETLSDAHFPHLIKLLGEGKDGYLDHYFGGRVTERVESVLRRLLSDPATTERTRQALVEAIEEPDREHDKSRRAWASLQFLIAMGAPPYPEVAGGLVRHGLWFSGARTKAVQRIHELLLNPSSAAPMASALRSGLTDPQMDVSMQCAALISETGISLTAADQLAHRDTQLRSTLTVLESDSSRTPDASDGQVRESIIRAMLADPDTHSQAMAALAEKLWSKNSTVVWFAARLLVETGSPQIHGVLGALVNIGLSADEWRPSAFRYLTSLRTHPILCHATRAAAIEGLQGRTDRVAQELRRKESGTRTRDPFKREDDAVASACAILVMESDEPLPDSLLAEVVPAALRHAGQALLARDHVLRLLTTDRRSKVLESIAQFFEDESMAPGVASVVAKALAAAGYTEVQNLSRGLVLGGLSQRGDHEVILEYLGRMLEDPQFVTSARKALAEGIESQDANVAWGSVCCLCEKSERTDQGLPTALIRVGLTSEANKDRARLWLHELLLNPFTAQNAVDAAESSNRAPGPAWETARCLILARKFESRILPEFIALGGLSDREWHLDVLATVIPVLQEGGEFAEILRVRLWKALSPAEKETNKPHDVAWGAARLLIEARQVVSLKAGGEKGGEPEEHDQLLRLLKVIAREVTREPTAAQFLTMFADNAAVGSAIRLALIELLDDESAPVAFEAARCLFELRDFEHLSLPVAVVRGGFGEQDRGQEARRMLEALRTLPEMAQAVRSALFLGMWGKDAETAWAAAAYVMDRGHRILPGVARGLVFGRREEWRDGGWETMERLEELLGDPETREQTIDALFSGLYEEQRSHRFDLIGLLVRAGAPLYDKLLVRMANACRWGMPAAPLAILALSGRTKEARDASERLGIRQMAELIGESPMSTTL